MYTENSHRPGVPYKRRPGRDMAQGMHGALVHLRSEAKPCTATEVRERRLPSYANAQKCATNLTDYQRFEHKHRIIYGKHIVPAGHTV